MNKLHLFGVFIASAALAACGGGDDDSAPAADTAATPEAGVEETSAPETDAGETMDGAGDMGEDAAPAEEPAEPEATEPEMAGGDEAPAEEAGSDDAAAGGEFMVAGLTGDPEAGRRVFARCRSCHVLDEGVNRVGPSLYGIIGREAGSVEGFRYSEANATSGVTWTEDNLFEYLENPREYIPGTIMAFPGLRDEQDRADVIAYIEANGGFGG